MDKFLAQIFKFLGNPKVQKVILVILVILVLLWVLRNANGKFDTWFRGNFLPVKGDNVNAPISEIRKQTLNNLATEVHSAIYGVPGFGYVESALENIYVLPDNELKYVAEYYQKTLNNNGKSLYYDIDYEWMPLDDVDDDIMSRLSAMNLV